MTRVGILTWDWREQPSLGDLRRILGDLGGEHLTISDVDTGSDQYAWAFSTRPLSDCGLQLAWRQYEQDLAEIFDLRENR